MAYYVDFVGLNTFIYETSGWDPEQQKPVFTDNDSYTPIFNTIGETTTFPNQPKNVPIHLNHMGCIATVVDHDHLNYFKNFLFSHNLPTTASFFPALMLKRNGPYGFPTWKQIRIGQNPLTRRQVKENIFTFVEEPGPEIVIDNNGKLNTVRGKYGAIKKFDENPVSSRYKPFVVGGASIIDDGTLERFELVSSYGNETIFFNNEEINKYKGLRVQRSTQYNTVKDFYLNGGLDKDGSPMDTFEFFSYRECVYPPRVYQYKNYTRQRTTFSFPWRDDRGDRTETNIENGFGSTVHQSKWILDANSAWPAQDGRTNKGSGLDVWFFIYGYQNPLDNSSEKNLDFGILQNTYCFGSNNIIDSSSVSNLPDAFRIAPLYNRKHTLTPSSSVVSPNGMILQGINSGSTFGNMTSLIEVPSGEAKWEAGSQSGLNPFYDTYDNYIQDVRQHGKDYSIIPEFRISEHVETYESIGLTEEVSNIFSLTGALSDTTDSSKDNFYKIYSTSEFMKHFEVVKKDHKVLVPASSISLKCKAIKKFLPYEGFYPAQRSVDLAKQFYNSYKDFTAASGAVDQYGTPNENSVLFQNLMVPTFAPGIFFNTIKSGVAVDYPLIDANLSIATNVTTSNNNYYIKATTGSPFNRRIPFEALVEPEKHLAGSPVYCNEPHIYANNSGSVSWDGGGNNRYKLMANNFLAETTEFFMREKNMTQITSLPSNDPNIGEAKLGKTYMMRVKMYKSTDQATIPNVSSSGGFYTPPQYGSSSRETFTMYSRPSAFGPPLYLTGNLASAYYDLPLADQGENYAFTPPYYYGQSWADITFTPTRSGKHSIQEIISGSTVAFHRYAPTETGNDEFFRSLGINAHAMDLNASVNLFSQTTAGTSGADPNDPPSRWVIQTKFETPMLNFNHLSASDSITLPNNASQSVPRGMWHQYGNIESDPTKGIFLQVDSVPDAWIDESLSGDSSTVESLADLCGFTTETKRLGEVADTKEIREAVVAVPFIEEEGNRKFFRIPRIDITRAFGTETERALVGDSVLKMIVKMQGYVMPPSMDFLNNNTVDPFAMYIFEFSHTLKKQDLANIWQNLYPEIGQTFETAESSISHELLAHELLGGGAKLNPEGTLDVNAVGNEIPDRVRWMVFKVKQRANIDYNLKIIGRKNINIFEGANTEITYNWPYDFFSLVELAKIETEVKFAERAIKAGQEPRSTIVPKVSTKSSTKSIDEIRNEARMEAKTIRRNRNITRAKSAATEALGDGSKGDITNRNRQQMQERRKTQIEEASGGNSFIQGLLEDAAEAEQERRDSGKTTKTTTSGDN
jgi:hypothetical protein